MKPPISDISGQRRPESNLVFVISDLESKKELEHLASLVVVPRSTQRTSERAEHILMLVTTSCILDTKDFFGHIVSSASVAHELWETSLASPIAS